MSQHTPGPWTLQHLESQHNGYDNWNVFVIRSPQNVALAEVGRLDRYEHERIEANARLIAAAPRMLELLQEVETQCESFDTGHEKGRAAFILMLTRLGDNARALLKEIEG